MARCRILGVAVATVLGWWAVSPRAAEANDTTLGGVAGQLQPLQETRISMVREDIRLASTNGEQWRVEADYWFHNHTRETVSVQVGFPEAATCTCEGCDWSDPSFRDMEIWVDDQLVTFAVDAMQVSSGTSRSEPCLARVFVYDMTFAPQQRVAVRHRYTQSASATGADAVSVRYVTTTGANWAGPIAHARFEFRLSPGPEDRRFGFPGAAGGVVQYSPNITPTGRREFFDEGNRVLELVFEATNWTPTSDVEVTFVSGQNPMLAARYALGAMCIESGWLADRWPEMSHEALRVASDDALRLARNGPYAAHGYPFDSDELRAIFYAGPWLPDPVHSRAQPSEAPVAPFMPNPDYSDALLYDVERECIGLVRAEERRRAELRARGIDPQQEVLPAESGGAEPE